MLNIGGQKMVWTEHSRIKMRQYRLSESRIKRVLRHPKRLEVGVAPDTVAGMQPAGSKKHPYELWVMWATKVKNSKLKVKSKFELGRSITIISTWRYPGVSPVHEPPPIPEEVWAIVRKEAKG
jgi:hypothetical protein